MTNTINTAAATLTIPMTINRTKSYKMGPGLKHTRTMTFALKKDVPAKVGKAGNSKFRSAYMAWLLDGFSHTSKNGILEISKGSLRRAGLLVLKDEGDFIAFQVPSNRKMVQARIYRTKAAPANIAKGMTHYGLRADRNTIRYANEILSAYGAEIVTYSPAGQSKTDSEAYLVKADGTHVQLEFDKTYRIPANGAKIPANIINL